MRHTAKLVSLARHLLRRPHQGDEMRHTPIFLLIVAGLAAVVPSQSIAAAPEDAEAAYSNADYATAMRLWRSLAEQGDAEAEFHLGVMYAFGQGVPNDYAQAVTWYRKAAEQGHRKAQKYLGDMYANGFGVPKDRAEATKWYQLANTRETSPEPNVASATATDSSRATATVTCPMAGSPEASAQSSDSVGAKPGDRFSLVLTEIFPGKQIWKGYFVLGAADPAHAGAFNIAELQVVVGSCAVPDECTYSRPKARAVFYPNTKNLQAVEGNPPCIAFYYDASGKNLGNFSIAGNEWGAYNSREPRFARNGGVAIQKDVSAAR